MRLDRTFRGAYEFEFGEWPAGGRDQIFWYPGASTVGGRDGLLLSVSPTAGRPWLGVFAFGEVSPRGDSGAVALPDRRTLAVLSKGAVYRVSANNPLQWEKLLVSGAVDPVIAEDLELVLFVGYTTVLAYGQDGLAWATEPLVWDDLQTLDLDGDVMHLKGFDAPQNESVSFSLDVRTGRSSDAPHPDRRLRRVN